MNIEIGGGTLAGPGWVNIDPQHGEGEWKRYAQHAPWPTGDNTAETIRAFHSLEHISAGADRLNVFNEAHRVLRPGGVFDVRVPNALSPTWHAWADPTHVSFWVPQSFRYFDGVFAANADYGQKLWTTLELTPDEIVPGSAVEIHWRGTPR